ncbi:MAG: hypothetical protein LBF56_02910 [Holosporales bacterium]|jgi:hypothetical protein|nr:hypothetical protein [Holosporales bacterium]
MSKNKISKLSVLALALVATTSCALCQIEQYEGEKVVLDPPTTVINKDGMQIQMHDDDAYFNNEFVEICGLNNKNAMALEMFWVYKEYIRIDKSEKNGKYLLSPDDLYAAACSQNMGEIIFSTRKEPTTEAESNEQARDTLINKHTKFKIKNITERNIGHVLAIEKAGQLAKQCKEEIAEYEISRKIHDEEGYFSRGFDLRNGLKLHLDQTEWMKKHMTTPNKTSWLNKHNPRQDGELALHIDSVTMSDGGSGEIHIKTEPVHTYDGVKFKLCPLHIVSRIYWIVAPEMPPSLFDFHKWLDKTEEKIIELRDLSGYKENIGWTESLGIIQGLRGQIQQTKINGEYKELARKFWETFEIAIFREEVFSRF